MSEQPDLSKLSFEQALKQLEKIVEDLSSDDIDIEALVMKYTEGMRYLEYCNVKLNEAEAKLMILSDKLPPPAEEN